ncbi:phosphatase PAP2 family protein [Caballeronia sp. LZ062]|uniref:phosphatase PAP2 family protein n=1 Tax=unclassified Caballeronia TaxID=2646786 RepID=UPI002862CBAD|nr:MULTISPECIES: phosphatase PAP2 family protein [unclassified Caballeronia]MDR5856925.1 phosphatase PAP2 family protein [Caballeronia sp. LZ050]MDR5869678.1 phosphatase PAP2 family protein [Caballeronia sp. LZ062]
MNFDLPASLWMSITALGSIGVMLPVGLAAAAWLALGYRCKYTFAWLALLGAGSACVAFSKIAFIGWGIGVRTLDFTGISGHAFMATAVLPVALFVALLPARGALRAAGVAVGLLLGVVVGGSRVVVNAHSVSEVVAGCVLGGAVAIAFAWIARKAEPGKLSPTPVAASLGAVVVALHGVPVPTQHWITEIALGLSGHERPYVRARWKAKIYRAPERRADLQVPRERAAA